MHNATQRPNVSVWGRIKRPQQDASKIRTTHTHTHSYTYIEKHRGELFEWMISHWKLTIPNQKTERERFNTVELQYFQWKSMAMIIWSQSVAWWTKIFSIQKSFQYKLIYNIYILNSSLKIFGRRAIYALFFERIAEQKIYIYWVSMNVDDW